MIFGPVPSQNMSGKKGCGAKQAVTLVLVLAPESIKKMTEFVIMTVHGEAP